MVKQAVIIAGGSGSRLVGGGINTPKPLLKVGGKSIIEWQIINLEREGISEIIFLLGQKAEEITNYVKTLKARTSCRFSFIVEQSPLGTGGALLNAINSLDDVFIVLYGDLLMDCNLKKLISDSEKSELGSIALRPSDHPSDSDLVQITLENEISDIFLKPNSLDSNRRNLAMTGLMCLNKKILMNMRDILDFTTIDLEKNIIKLAVNSRGGLKSSKLNGFIKDLGTIDRLEEAEESWRARLQWREPYKTVILDRDGVVNYLSGDIKDINQFRIVEDFSSSVEILKEKNFKIFVATNQPGIAKGYLSWNELSLLHGFVDMELSKKGLFLDGWYVCPHHPEKGFVGEILKLKFDCMCRKPKAGLIEQIKEDFHLDLKTSWFVGDQITDFQLATSVGLAFVQIGDFFEAPPDVPKFDKLKDACEYIVNHDKL
jgi:mannose-1-phosphate guanylyltransferase/phosphomannomutase